jgi:PilZ domain
MVLRSKSDLRQSRRYGINTHLKIFRLVNGEQKIIPGYARNISTGGMAAFVPAQLAIGETLEIQFAFPGFPENLTVSGIVRTIERWQHGIEFIKLDNAIERIIAEYSNRLTA